jgi:aspartate/methionine/tyrosine aminotransferase
MNESHRIQSVQSPIIPVITELIRTHPGTISLGQGVVSYGPPPEAIEQIGSFLADSDNHKYKAVHGIPELLNAVGKKLKMDNGIDIAKSETEDVRIVITPGGNMAFVNALLAIADPGDEIILLTPYYFNHEMACAMANCRPVGVATDDNYQPRLEAIRSAITSRTRAIVTVSPNNPTGAVYPEKTLRTINELCRERKIYHIHDEAYEYFTWNEARHFSPASIAGAYEHTISLFSLSKSYGFASWRIGYLLVPAVLFEAIRKIQDTLLICPPVISQWAAVGALNCGAVYCKNKCIEIGQVRDLVAAELYCIRHLCTIGPADGAFYFFIKVHADRDSMHFAEQLVREHGVAVIPGNTFGMTNGCYLRLSYGPLSKETASLGIGRLVRGIKAIVER